jgi:methyl-accepting chemotaxis protein
MFQRQMRRKSGAQELFSSAQAALEAVLSAYYTKQEERAQRSRVAEFAEQLLQHCGETYTAIIEGQVAADIGVSEAHRAREGARAIRASAHGVAQLSQDIRLKSKDAGDSARKGLGATSRAAKAVSEAVLCMTQVDSSLRAAEALLNSLCDAAAQATSIVGVIERVAAQTRLLALNAKIEASRSGASSRAFSVVAEEVKSLSGMTTKANDEVRDRLTLIAEQTRIVAVSARESAAHARSGKLAVQRAAENVAEAVSHVTLADQQAADIPRALDGQLQACELVLQHSNTIEDACEASLAELIRAAEQAENVESAIERQLSELFSFDAPSKRFHVAQAEHWKWVRELSKMTRGRPTESAALPACEFSSWLAEAERTGDVLFSMAKTTAVHRLVHTVGKEVCEAHARGDSQRALALVARLSALTSDLFASLSQAPDAPAVAPDLSF